MIVFCDFDGTITTVDTLDFIIQGHYGKILQKQFELSLINGEISGDAQLKEILNEMGLTIDEIIDKLNKIPNLIDDSFLDFYELCRSSSIEFHILSSGFKKIIQHFLPIENVIANNIEDVKNSIFINKLEIVKTLGKDKKCIYIGDGTSDFEVVSTLKNMDVYVKRNSILHTLCITSNLKHTVFDTFSDLGPLVINSLKLLAPGVVKVNKKVLSSMGQQHTFMHRNNEFHGLYDKISYKLKNLVTYDTKKYTTMLVTGSGTSSMDEVINAFVDDNMLILSNGLFGERWYDIAKFYNSNVHVIKNKWGVPFNVDEIKQTISDKKIKAVILVHCDTSVGILNDIQSITKVVGCTFIVDSVSTFGCVPINMCELGIDILVTNPNKALASLMGIGIIIGRNDILDNLKDHKRSYSLNLKKHYEYAMSRETCNTCSIQTLNSLATSLDSFKSPESVVEMNKLHKILFDKIYYGVKYPKLLPHEISCPSIITLLHDKSQEIIKYLFNNGYVVYECKGDLLNKGFQISFYGYDGKIKNICNVVELLNNFSSPQ